MHSNVGSYVASAISHVCHLQVIAKPVYYRLSALSPTLTSHFLPLSLCLSPCVSGEFAANGQHWIQCPGPAGPSAAWQGTTLITVLFLSQAVHPVCLAPPLCCPLHNYTAGSPRSTGSKTTFISADGLCVSWSAGWWILKCVFPSGFCEGGHPDEGQQEESTASSSVSGKRCFLLVITGVSSSCTDNKFLSPF